MADILQMHDLKPAPGANKDRIRVGRGEGSKGRPRAVATRAPRSAIRFVRASKVASCRCTCAFRSCVASRTRSRRNTRSSTWLLLRELFPGGGEITVALGCQSRPQRLPVKVLGDGEVSAAYTLKGVKASASAKSKIEAAGGSISED